MMSAAFKDPAILLHDLGITEPSEILIEAIAAHCGATVVYEHLEGCEARIIGKGDDAIITVNRSSARGRQRFSVGHELGHWMFDRNRIGFACTEANLIEAWESPSRERRANRFAAELLLPSYIFAPYARKHSPTMETVRELAGLFETSFTATAVRLVEIATHPAMVVCSQLGDRCWFVKSALVPDELWPTRRPGQGSVAARLFSGEPVCESEDVDADAWVDHRDAHRYCVHEGSILMPHGRVLSMIWWRDESQIADIESESDEE